VTRPKATASDVHAAPSVPEPTDREFAGFCDVILRHAGIHLNASKRALLYGRLSPRVRELGLPSLGVYLRHVTKDRVELQAMIDRVTTNETHFFREPMHFSHLSSSIVPAWLRAASGGRRSRKVRAWSAGCSTGEEPYSLAMFLLDRLPVRDGWTLDILATDISTRVLEAARRATWSMDRAAEIPEPLLKRFMLEGIGSQRGKLRASPELRAVVRIEQVNLNDRTYSVGAPFDLIFCRNVLIYFGQEQRRRVIERLVSHLVPEGYLFVGHAEGVHSVPGLWGERPTIYAKSDRAGGYS